MYPSYFKLQMRWLRSRTPVTYLCTLLGMHSLAAFLQLEVFRVEVMNVNYSLMRQISSRAFYFIRAERLEGQHDELVFKQKTSLQRFTDIGQRLLKRIHVILVDSVL